MALDWLKSRLNSGPLTASRRNQRIDAEVTMIAPRFSRPPYCGVYYDEENRDWLVIPSYPLPARFRERSCDLLIVFPEGYPEMPPIGFYLNQRFELNQGGHDAHATGKAYHGAPDLTDQGWHWYCVQMDMQSPGAWRPQADHCQPDNLWTFLNMVREALTNDH
jgi:hypothetical protein